MKLKKLCTKKIRIAPMNRWLLVFVALCIIVVGGIFCTVKLTNRQETDFLSTEFIINSNGYTVKINSVTFDMIHVEGGTFAMGTSTEQSGEIDEKPTHSVKLSSFSIGETEVTQALWQVVMSNNPSYFTGNSQLPVEQVSWKDCQKFLRKLNRLTGKNFRLPTEAEWEYAARGGNKSHGYKYCGSNNIDDVAWFNENSGDKYLDNLSKPLVWEYYDDNPDWALIEENNCKTHIVKQKEPNELGLYDMSGNVSEWCSDRYNESYYAKSPVYNPKGPSLWFYRVCRGGSWFDYASFCRSSFRGSSRPGYSFETLGLRLALSE